MQKIAVINAQPFDLPNALALELTSHCNLKCKGCPLTTRRSLSSAAPGNISDALWDKIIPIARQVKQVTIGGFGEPLTNPQCIPLLQQLNDQRVYMGISTNGHLLSRSISSRLAALKYLTHINISIDSPDPEEYRRFRGARLENAMNGVKNIMHQIDNPSRVTVSSIVMNRNLSNLAKLPVVLRKFGVKKYILQGLIAFNPEFKNEYQKYHKKLSSNLEKIMKACQKAGIQLQFTTPDRFNKEIQDIKIAKNIYYSPKKLKPNETRQCCLPWNIPFINKDGDVFPCCYAASSGNSVMGNLNGQDWIAIWHGHEFRRFRRELLDGATTPSICSDCTLAPWGKHFYQIYKAKVISGDLISEKKPKLRLVVQNTGTKTWTQEDLIRIGTLSPRDSESIYAHKSWLASNRSSTFDETKVSPGQKATFSFQITTGFKDRSELFQLVADGEQWLPNTQFEIRSTGFWRKLISPISAGAQANSLFSTR